MFYVLDFFMHCLNKVFECSFFKKILYFSQVFSKLFLCVMHLDDKCSFFFRICSNLNTYVLRLFCLCLSFHF
jgi:hypothetical protein